ncbi:MAG: 50S ribosomal protein L10 [Ruminococcus sp.]|nr:50S ribosomal protein L10 [Ruminococcus sp.]
MASEKVLASKKEKVANLAELLKNSTSGALVDYQGVTVEEDTALRREMRENNVTYFVEKNTMLRLAFKEAGIEGLDEVLNGATAIAVSADDETAPARILGKYSEQFGDGKFELKAGFIGETVYDKAGVTALSKIPSKETLLAQLVGSLQGPLTKLAATLKAVADSKSDDGDAA